MSKNITDLIKKEFDKPNVQAALKSVELPVASNFLNGKESNLFAESAKNNLSSEQLFKEQSELKLNESLQKERNLINDKNLNLRLKFKNKPKLNQTGDITIDNISDSLISEIENNYYENLAKIDKALSDRRKEFENLDYDQFLNSMSDTFAVGANATSSLVTGSLMAMQVPKILQDIVSASVSLITEEATGLISQSVREMIVSPAAISAYTIESFNKHKKTMGEVMKEMFVDYEEIAKINELAAEANTLSEFNNKLNKKINSTTKKISQYSGIANEKINSLMAYVSNGPDWLADKVSKEVNNIVKLMNNFSYSSLKMNVQNIRDFEKNTGELAGKKMAEKYNKQLEKNAKELLDKVNLKKRKAQIVAKASMQLQLLLVMAKTGINIPI